jgi:multidrug resistance efflux pump
VTLLPEVEDRRREVARMMAGATVTPAALEHAGALIAAARAQAVGERGAERGRRAAPGRTAARSVSAA